MSKLEKLEHEVASLKPAELSNFRQWFATFDAEAWDSQLSADVAAGRLDSLANVALREHAAGKSKPL